MALTPTEIRTHEFRKAFRGVDPKEVAAFLDQIATELEGMFNEELSLRERTTGLETQLKDYQNIEKILQQTLLQAQETSSRSVENARKESELLMQQTEIKASQLLDQARRDLTGIKEQITVLLAKKEYIISRMKMLLASEMETLKMLEGDPDLAATQQVPLREKTAGGSELDEIIRNIE